jgi:hypothetical protein
MLTALALALTAGAAYAQDAPAPATSSALDPNTSPPHNPPWRDRDNGSVYQGPQAATPSGSDVVYESSPTPANEAWRLTQRDPDVVTNGTVPDTLQNRQRYGGPMSHAGKMTPPTGD